MRVCLQMTRIANVSSPTCRRDRKINPWQMPMELHSHLKAVCSQLRAGSCFINPLLPRSRTTLGECQRNYIAHPWDHPSRFDSSHRGRPDGKALLTGGVWAGPQTVSLPLSPRQTYPANAGGTTLMDRSRVQIPSPLRGSSVGRAIHLCFAVPLLPDPKSPLANAGWNYIVDVKVVGSNPTPATMAG